MAKMVVAMLVWCAGAAPAAAPRTPDAIAVEFYGWYLDTLAADQDPLSDRGERFGAYVARSLEARLAGRLRAGQVPDSDYFLQAPHYHGNWLRQRVQAVTVRHRSGRERGADVIVTLGAGAEPTRMLALAMVREQGAWKIRNVHPVRRPSAQEPVN